jgi:hypothetical protein
MMAPASAYITLAAHHHLTNLLHRPPHPNWLRRPSAGGRAGGDNGQPFNRPLEPNTRPDPVGAAHPTATGTLVNHQGAVCLAMDGSYLHDRGPKRIYDRHLDYSHNPPLTASTSATETASASTTVSAPTPTAASKPVDMTADGTGNAHFEPQPNLQPRTGPRSRSRPNPSKPPPSGVAPSATPDSRTEATRIRPHKTTRHPRSCQMRQKPLRPYLKIHE